MADWPDWLPEPMTPGRFADASASLDASVRALDAAINASTSPRVNARWRAEWHKFVRRWELERDAYASWYARTVLMKATLRLGQFMEHYQWWAADFELRNTGRGQLPVQAVSKAPVKPLGPVADTDVPDVLWWILGAAAVAYAVSAGRR